MDKLFSKFKDNHRRKKCNENIEVNLDLPNGERLHVTPDVASVLSETHDNLPKEMQQSFREMVFESKDKYTKILETIVTGEEQ